MFHWRDYKDFLDDLEEDKEFRQQVNIYFGELLWQHYTIGIMVMWADPSVHPLATEERAELDADVPTIQLDEMLGGLTLQDNMTWLCTIVIFCVQDFELDILEEAYTTEHWIVRIYKVKDLENRGNWLLYTL